MNSKNLYKKRSLCDAFQYRGCSICYVLDKDETDFIAQLQYQTIKEEKVLREIVFANGYCNFHFHQMGRMASPLGMAILSRELINEEIKEIESGSFWQRVRVDCPVCKFVREREGSYLREFKILLYEESFQKEYEATDGLCRIHLQKVLDLMDEEKKRRFLISTQLFHLKLLRSELEIFITKTRSTSRNFGDEKNSWCVAIEKIIGKKGLNCITFRKA